MLDEGALALVQLGALGHLEYGVLFLFGLLALLIIGMHITLRVVAPDADPLILPIVTVLNGLGIAMIYRIDLAYDLSGWENGGLRQLA